MSLNAEQNKRQDFLQILIPALVIVVGYILFFHRAESQKVERLTKSLAEVKSKAPNFRDIQQAQQLQRQIQKDQNELKSQKERFQVKRQELLSSFNHGQKRAENFDRFHSLLKDHNLIVVESEKVQKVPQRHYSESMLKALNVGSSKQQSNFWKVEILGQYAAVHEALIALKKSDLPIYVVALDLEATDNKSETGEAPDFRTWTVTIWI